MVSRPILPILHLKLVAMATTLERSEKEVGSIIYDQIRAIQSAALCLGVVILAHCSLSTQRERKRSRYTNDAYPVCRSVCLSVGLESVLWQNGCLDLDAI